MTPHKRQYTLAAVALIAFSVMSAGCHRAATPHLTQIAAVRLAASMPCPEGYNLHEYAYRGSASFYAPLRQWGVLYESPPGKPVAIGADYYAVWIDDTTGKFVRYSYAR